MVLTALGPAGQTALSFFLTTILPVWLIGLVTGLLFPRQPVLSDVRAFLATSVLGAGAVGTRSTVLSQVMMFVNAFTFVQSMWFRWTPPGTFHRLCASVLGTVGLTGKAELETDDDPQLQAPQPGAAVWHVDESDLKFFRNRVESTSVPNAGAWEVMLEKVQLCHSTHAPRCFVRYSIYCLLASLIVRYNRADGAVTVPDERCAGGTRHSAIQEL
jgi:hypothetical protein